MDHFIESLTEKATHNNRIDKHLYDWYNVKRGLRNRDGTGVLVGLTEIGDVHGYVISENEKIPVNGELYYRGVPVNDLVKAYEKEKRFGFEEICYLLLFGEFPCADELTRFRALLEEKRTLPNGFTESMILKAPSNDIMNKMARSVLALYSYDDDADNIQLYYTILQSIALIARFPSLAAYGYQAKAHNYDNQSLFIHRPDEQLSTSENFLRMTRASMSWTPLEAELLDTALILHAEHGGGNNSAFAIHVVTSSGTDIYSAVASALGCLKGPKHGGANIKVREMVTDIKEHVKDWKDEDEIRAYLQKILRKDAYDRSGLVYGVGHAVYTLSDPRAVLLKEKARDVADEKQRLDEFDLYERIERLAPSVVAEHKNSDKSISANVDFYSGFVYDMLSIPMDLYTPLFAVARIAGWCAHRIEELVSGGRIIRPAYKNVMKKRAYVPLDKR
jgi:citrate synthase